MNNLNEIINKIKANEVIAYPTEAVFGLGCNPTSEKAVRQLLTLKNRSEEKGLILIAPTLDYFRPFIDETKLSSSEWQKLETIRDQAITWIVPAKPTVPTFLRGNFSTIAVRLCKMPVIETLCQAVGFALTSTSANLSGLSPCRTAEEVKAQFGENFPVLDAETGGKENPSEIRDILTQQILRQG